MTSYRLKLTRVNSLKLKTATRIPAQLVGGTGILIEKANGVYTFSTDTEEIEQVAETAATNVIAAAIGSSIQGYDADLAALAALTGTNTIYYRSAASTWSPVTIGSNLSFTGGTLNADPALGVAFEDLSALDLTGLTALTVWGRAARGDAPSLALVRSASDPAGVPSSLKVQSSDGAYWYPSTSEKIYAEHAGGIVGATAAATTTAIQAIIDYAKICYLTNARTYEISSQITCDGDDEGLVCPDGKATLYMQTGSGEFDENTLWNITAAPADAIGVRFISMDRPTLKNIRITMEASGSLRTCIPLVIRDCTDLDIDRIECDGFQTVRDGAVVLDSVVGGKISNIHVHTIATTDVTLASLQMSGISIDGNRMGGVSSRITIENYDIHDITQNQASITQYNYQTDGITVAGAAGGGTGLVKLINGRIKNVAEAIDLQAWHTKVSDVYIESALVCAFKLVHDCRFVEISGNIEVNSTGGPAFYVAGTSNGTVGPADIDIIGGQYFAIGAITLTGPTSIPKAFIATDGVSATHQPRRIRWQGPRVELTDADHFLNMGNGTIFKIERAEVLGTPATAMCTIASGSEIGTVFTLNTPSVVRAARSANFTPGATTAAIVCDTEIEDTNSEFASGIFTAKRPMRAVVSASVRTGTLATTKYISVLLFADGAHRSVQLYRNTGAGTVEAHLEASAIVNLLPGETVLSYVQTDDAGMAVTGDGTEQYTHLQIQEIN